MVHSRCFANENVYATGVEVIGETHFLKETAHAGRDFLLILTHLQSQNAFVNEFTYLRIQTILFHFKRFCCFRDDHGGEGD